MKGENNELAMAYSKKDEENRQLRDQLQEYERKHKATSKGGKEASKYKKACKEKEREIKALKADINNHKIQNEDFRQKIEELVKKSAGPG